MLHRWYCTNSYFSQSVASFIYDKVDNIGSLIWKFSHKFLPHIFIKRSSSASAKTRKIPQENFSLRFWNSFHFCFISFSNYIHASTSPWVLIRNWHCFCDSDQEQLTILSVAKDAVGTHPESFDVIGSRNVFVISLWGYALCQSLWNQTT